jgi:phosphoribosylanthranilate isomerase
MPRTRIKICGITRPEDALAAERAGCDAVGFVFWEGSKRFVTLSKAREACRGLSPLVATVGVFVSPSCGDVANAASEAGLTAAQLCGPLPDGDWKALSSQMQLIRAVGVSDGVTLNLDEIEGVNDYLFDTRDDHAHGGTGQTFDWSLLRQQTFNGRVWLAGGLDASNVGRAIRTVRPYAVDVSTGVESEPGMKSAERIAAFVGAVRLADSQMIEGSAQ